MASALQVVIESKKEKESELKELLNTFVEISLENSACQKCELYQLDENRESFFIIQIWKNEKKRASFLESLECKNLYKEIENLSFSISSNALKLPQCLTKLGLK